VGNHISRKDVLAKLDALFAALFAASTGFSVLWLDLLPVLAVVVVVIDVTMLGRILGGVSVVFLQCMVAVGAQSVRLEELS